MRFLAILSASFLAHSVFGAQWSVVGPCGPEPVHAGAFQADLRQSVGALTVEALSARRIPFEGGEGGIASLLGVGNLTEVIESERMRFYGWCYSVNGATPEVMPDRVFLNSQSDRIVWFYAYTLYDRGNWIGQCTPAWEAPPRELCAGR